MIDYKKRLEENNMFHRIGEEVKVSSELEGLSDCDVVHTLQGQILTISSLCEEKETYRTQEHPNIEFVDADFEVSNGWSSPESKEGETLELLAKAYAIGTYTSSHGAAEDYDEFMSLKEMVYDEDGNQVFEIWEPFETYPLDEIQELAEQEFSSALNLIKRAIRATVKEI